MGYQKILVTLDGSGLSELALQYVPEVADQGAQVHILSVVDHVGTIENVGDVATLYSAMNSAVILPGPEYPAFQSMSIPQAIDTRLDYLSEVSDWLVDKGYQVTVEARPGEVVHTIVDVAKEGYEILIMAMRGGGGLRRVLLGSVAEGVVRRAPCPVLLVPIKE